MLGITACLSCKISISVPDRQQFLLSRTSCNYHSLSTLLPIDIRKANALSIPCKALRYHEVAKFAILCKFSFRLNKKKCTFYFRDLTKLRYQNNQKHFSNSPRPRSLQMCSQYYTQYFFCHGQKQNLKIYLVSSYGIVISINPNDYVSAIPFISIYCVIVQLLRNALLFK